MRALAIASRLAAVLLLSVVLQGCWITASVDTNTTTSRNTLYAAANSYGVALSAMQAYKSLPLCATGTQPSFQNVCAKRSIIENLQAANKRAVAALDRASAFIAAFPTVDASNVIAAAQQAVLDLKAILGTTGVLVS